MLMFILMLDGNSLEIGCKMRIGFLGGEFGNLRKKLPAISGGKVCFQVISGMFLGIIGLKWSQYAIYFHLGPI